MSSLPRVCEELFFARLRELPLPAFLVILMHFKIQLVLRKVILDDLPLGQLVVKVLVQLGKVSHQLPLPAGLRVDEALQRILDQLLLAVTLIE